MCFIRMSSQKVSCEERPNLAYYCALQHFLSKYKKTEGKNNQMLQHGQTETDGQPPVSIKTSIHQLLRLIFPSHTRPTVYLLFFSHV